MTRMVYCAKLKKEGEGLDYLPYPGEMGKRIYDHISKEAWNAWVQRQTMLVNEYRLNMTDPQARRFLAGQMQAFLFEEEQEDRAGKEPSSL
ncbi:MAG: oxidative damage protection protein [Oxalobacter formigenes]|nr:oxidative damage protection protein [Oxalobacter formigenes]